MNPKNASQMTYCPTAAWIDWSHVGLWVGIRYWVRENTVPRIPSAKIRALSSYRSSRNRPMVAAGEEGSRDKLCSERDFSSAVRVAVRRGVADGAVRIASRRRRALLRVRRMGDAAPVRRDRRGTSRGPPGRWPVRREPHGQDFHRGSDRPRVPGSTERERPPGDLGHVRPFHGVPFALVPRAPGGADRRAVPPEIGGGGSPGSPGPAIAPPGEPTVSGGRAAFLVTRTGYTGEPGFELFPAAREGSWVWDALLKSGEDLGARPIGLGARDTLRLEKGYLLSGQDFDGQQTPLEVNSAWLVKWERPFIGREALVAQRERDDYLRLVGVRMEDRGIPRPGFRVVSRGSDVGHVTSGTMSPSLRVGIALASVDKGHATEGTSLEVDIRGTTHPARVVSLPFL